MTSRFSIADGDIELANTHLAVRLRPSKGADVAAIRHLASGGDILWQTPWPEGRASAAVHRPGSPLSWIERCGGGWQLVLPNGGDECSFDGVEHHYHGDAALLPWDVEEADATHALMTVRLLTLPLAVARRYDLDGDLLSVRTDVTNEGPIPVRLMWVEHVGLGGTLLDGTARLSTGARSVVVDGRYDDPSNRLRQGAHGAWPLVAGTDGGDVDLRAVVPGASCLAYLTDFSDSWVGLCRTDGSLGTVVTWDAGTHPYAWLWQQLRATQGPPWFGRANAIGVEPATSWPGQGLAMVASTTRNEVTLGPGERRTGLIAIHVFSGMSEVTGATRGRATGRLAKR